MLKNKIVLLFLATIITGCQDRISDAENSANVIAAPVIENKCDSSSVYSGINSIVDITDTTAKITWPNDSDSIGYILFQENSSGLEVLKKMPPSQLEYTVPVLQAETNYRFLVRSINPSGKFDCNENFQDITTTEKETFISCNEIHTHYLGAKPSGVYEIDTDLAGPKPAFDVYCDMDNNDGGWTRVFTHNTSAGLFADSAEASEVNTEDTTNDKYSILSKLEEFKKLGKYEFWLYYPEHDGADGGNIWTQTSNPVTDLITGYVAIRETYNGMHWGGLEKSSTTATLIDGSVGHDWWFYAIGSSSYWPSTGTIPGPMRSQGVSEVQLFIR